MLNIQTAHFTEVRVSLLGVSDPELSTVKPVNRKKASPLQGVVCVVSSCTRLLTASEQPGIIRKGDFRWWCLFNLLPRYSEKLDP